MEKQNVVSRTRTPCKAPGFCDCPDCTEQRAQNQKQASDKPVSINDTEALARIHK